MNILDALQSTDIAIYHEGEKTAIVTRTTDGWPYVYGIVVSSPPFHLAMIKYFEEVVGILRFYRIALDHGWEVKKDVREEEVTV